nr:hypothetical protein [Gelidibacter japonicus]
MKDHLAVVLLLLALFCFLEIDFVMVLRFILDLIYSSVVERLPFSRYQSVLESALVFVH